MRKLPHVTGRYDPVDRAHTCSAGVREQDQCKRALHSPVQIPLVAVVPLHAEAEAEAHVVRLLTHSLVVRCSSSTHTVPPLPSPPCSGASSSHSHSCCSASTQPTSHLSREASAHSVASGLPKLLPLPQIQRCRGQSSSPSAIMGKPAKVWEGRQRACDRSTAGVSAEVHSPLLYSLSHALAFAFPLSLSPLGDAPTHPLLVCSLLFPLPAALRTLFLPLRTVIQHLSLAFSCPAVPFWRLANRRGQRHAAKARRASIRLTHTHSRTPTPLRVHCQPPQVCSECLLLLRFACSTHMPRTC